jgi:predicted Zn-dependent protease with MMP-like domain
MRLSPERFEQITFALADEILAELAPDLRADAEQVILQVEQQPTPEQRRAAELKPGTVLLGLYEGVPLVARHADTVLLFPDRITLFQRALQAGARTETELRAQIRHTLIHELAHYFGRTDEELLARGQY